MGTHSSKRPEAVIAKAITAASVAPTPRPTDRLAQKEPRPLGLRWRVMFMCGKSRSAGAVAFRRSLPIHAYVGPNGGGKSLCAVRDTLPALRNGKRVLSTVPLLQPWDGQPWPTYEPLTHADQLLDARDCELLLDEMVGIANARESMSLDPALQNLFVQLRRRNVTVRWTAPNFARSDKIIREVTQAVTECRGFYADPRGLNVDQWGEKLIWAPKRLFHFRTFDTVEFEEWTTGKRDKAETEAEEWYYAPAWDDREAYNTLGAVEAVAGMAKNKDCPNCGGHRRVAVCKCENEAGEDVAGAARRVSILRPVALSAAESVSSVNE